jgi:tetratricopeptide (TPR) repeat protein
MDFKVKMKTLQRILCALSASALLLGQQTPAPSRAAELLLGKARSLEARGRIDLAAQAWQQLLMMEPEQQDAIAGLARSAKARGNDAEAARLVEKLRKVNPANPAIQQVEAVVRNEKRNPQLQEAARLAQSGQAEKAVAAYRSAFGNNAPPAEWAIPYYETLAGTPGGWEQSTPALEGLLRKNPSAQEYKLSLGRIYTYRPATRMKGIALLETLSGGYARQGQQSWMQALTWENGSARSAESLRRYLGRYPNQELAAFAKKTQLTPGQDLLTGEDLRQAYKALKADDLEGAETLFNAALEKDPKQAGALAGIGFIRMKQENFAGALTSFEAAAVLAPGNRVVRDAVKEARFWNSMQQGSTALKESRSEEAVLLFKNAISERPNDPNVMEGYAGALMQRGDYPNALPVLERLVKADSTRVQSWMDLVNAKHRTLGSQAALDTIGRVPPAVALKLTSSVEYLMLVADIYQDAGQAAEARKVFARAVVLAERKTDLPAYVQMKLAASYSEFGESAKAANVYRIALEREPTNLDAWEGYLLANNRSENAAEALRKLQTLPVSVHAAAQSRPAFLRAVAALQTSAGNLSSAESLLNQVIAAETAKGAEASFATQLQISQLWLAQGKSAQAGQKFLDLTRSYPGNTEAWKGLILAHQKAGTFAEASEVIDKIPAAVAELLEADSDYVGAVAALYKETKTPEEAIDFLRTANARLTAGGRSASPALTTQLGWLLLNKPGSERELFVLLRNARSRKDFSPEERRNLDDIWSAWFLQSADRAGTAGDPQRAITTLQAGIRMLPADLRLQRSLGTALLTSGDAKRAVLAYKSAGLQGATSGDYQAAVGACLAAQEVGLGDQWLKEGLTKFPADHELLTLAGKQAVAKGDFKKAEAFWRLALQGIDAKSHESVIEGLRSGADGIADLKAGNPTDDAGTILLSSSRLHSGQVQPQKPATPHRLPWETSQAESAPITPNVTAANSTKSMVEELLAGRDVEIAMPKAAPRVLTSSLSPALGREPAPRVTSAKQEIDRMLGALRTDVGRTDLKQSLAETPRMTAVPQAPVVAKRGTASIDEVLPALLPDTVATLLEPRTPVDPTPERDRMLDRIKTIEGRDSPYAGLGGMVQSRNGQAGFEKVTIQEATLESSSILFRGLRATVIAKSVFADSGSPDGESLLRFGMLPQGDTFEAPSANGFGAEVQLSATNYGLRVGSTPRGFLVRNVIGGFRVRPAGGPITLTFDRDSVKDTILAYAGARDPLTRRVWGGVIANTGSAAGNWGTDKSGVYFNLGFQHLTGESVKTNRRIDGTMGTYWQLARTSAGSLKAGVNLFAMHYAKNLRFFTMGHGGYFSPQRFLLFNAPVTWSGKAKRLEYIVGTSVGSQSFTEDSSPYFPMDPLIQGKTGPYYPKLSSSGVNYNVDFRTTYQVAENWFLVGYLNVNNARFYSQQSAGLSIKYSFRPRPLDTDLSVPSIPDWRGRQPFGIQ